MPAPTPQVPTTPPIAYDPRYGGIPTIPSPTATAGQAVAGNIGNLGQLYQLAGGVNAFNIGQAQAPLIAGLPNYQQMIAESSGNIGQLLHGQVPTDVLRQLQQVSAERGISRGVPGSPVSNAAMLRLLGQTSLGEQAQGEQQLTAAIGRTPQPALFDPSRMFVTPEQQQQAAAAGSLYQSAPQPAQAAAEAMRAAQAGAAAAPRISMPGAGPAPTTTGTAGGGMPDQAYGALGVQAPARDPYAAWNAWYQSLPGQGGTAGTATTGAGDIGDLGSWLMDSGYSQEEAAAALGISPDQLGGGETSSPPEAYAGGVDEYY